MKKLHSSKHLINCSLSRSCVFGALFFVVQPALAQDFVLQIKNNTDSSHLKGAILMSSKSVYLSDQQGQVTSDLPFEAPLKLIHSGFKEMMIDSIALKEAMESDPASLYMEEQIDTVPEVVILSTPLEVLLHLALENTLNKLSLLQDQKMLLSGSISNYDNRKLTQQVSILFPFVWNPDDKEKKVSNQRMFFYGDSAQVNAIKARGGNISFTNSTKKAFEISLFDSSSSSNFFKIHVSYVEKFSNGNSLKLTYTLSNPRHRDNYNGEVTINLKDTTLSFIYMGVDPYSLRYREKHGIFKRGRNWYTAVKENYFYFNFEDFLSPVYAEHQEHAIVYVRKGTKEKTKTTLKFTKLFSSDKEIEIDNLLMPNHLHLDRQAVLRFFEGFSPRLPRENLPHNLMQRVGSKNHYHLRRKLQ